MKKSVLLALAALAVGGFTAAAQEVTYEPDCSQGYLLNKNKDNWFITAQGGTTITFREHDIKAPLKDRWGGAAALYVGKWVNPNFGFRFGANWIMPKGATTEYGMYRKMNAKAFDNGYYPEKFMGLGPEFDVLINLTNWWCGYKPERVYNCVLHGGAGAYWTWKRSYGNGEDIAWHRAHNTAMFVAAGLQNNFRLSRVVDLFFDVQYTLLDFQPDADHDLSIQAGLTFNLGKSEWECPVTAICPTEYYNSLEKENANLQNKLRESEHQVVELEQEVDRIKKNRTIVQDCEGLVTVYYPINQSGLSAREQKVLSSVASIMKENTDKRYVLTGYADNFTGTDAINDRLREARVDGVYNYLVNKCGVDASQLDKTTDNNNLYESENAQTAPMDRAVTIRYAE